MIVKFFSRRYSEWIIFDEINHFRYYQTTQAEPPREDCLDFTLGKEDSEPAGVIDFCFIGKSQAVFTAIRANSPVYLMNNTGKTIETI